MRYKLYLYTKRILDILFAILWIVLLMPLFIIISLFIVLDSKGGVLFVQKRVGKNGNEFSLFKFRTMHLNAEKEGKLTIGNTDKRITKAGYFLRKLKLDELPQLINIVLGQMSFVGPRPEVRDHVNHYTQEQLKVLKVTPGLTDFGSLKFIHESDILENSDKPQKIYLEKILPEKLKQNLYYIKHRNLITDFTIIIKTIFRIMRTIRLRKRTDKNK